MTDIVYCKSVPSYDDVETLTAAVEAVFAQAKSTKALHAGSKVLIKPNLLARHAPQAAVTTHPAVLRAAIGALLHRGVLPQDITVADSPGGPYGTALMKSLYKVSGLAAVCEETGAVLYTACAAAPRRANGVRVSAFNLIAPVHEADFILNLPKLKTHVMTGMSCAVKNIFGVVPGLEKAELHLRFPQPEDFGDMLVDLCECVKPQLHLVDGIVGMEGDGPAGGSPRVAGRIFGGENPYTIDLFVCRLFAMPVARVPYLAAAVRRGLCMQTLDSTLLRGDASAFAPLSGWVHPRGGNVNFDHSVPAFLRPLVRFGEGLVAPRPAVRKSRCIGCGKCAEICPAHTITVQNGKAYIAARPCIRCFCCHEMCPVKAIDVRRLALFRL